MKKPNSTTQGEVDRCRLGTYQITLSESGSVHFCICAFFLVTTFFDIRTFVHKISGLKIENVMVGSCQFFQQKDINHVFIQMFISGMPSVDANLTKKRRNFQPSGIRVSSWRDGWQNTHRISPWALIAQPHPLEGLEPS